MSGVQRSGSLQDLRDANLNFTDFSILKKAVEEVDGLHGRDTASTPSAGGSGDFLVEKTPDFLLVDKTPEGHRRIRGQKTKRGMEGAVAEEDDLNNNWSKRVGTGSVGSKVGIPRPDRGNYIPFPATSTHNDVLDEFGIPSSAANSINPVELQVTNLDQSIDQKEMKKLISTLFKEHVSVLHVSVFFQSDGNMAACVRVPSLSDAQFAISQLHRKKVGYKRILISHSQNSHHNPAILRSKVASILKEVPGGRIQLFKFREMFEKRFHDSIGVSDLYKMKDLVFVTDDAEGRMVQLSPGYQHKVATPEGSTRCESYAAAAASAINKDNHQDVILDLSFCPTHSARKDESDVGWAERENGVLLPNVNISLSVLGPNVKSLIRSHGGALPLSTLPNCYEAVFGKDTLPVDTENGVPLEHLVTCVRGVQIAQAPSGSKRLLLLPIGQLGAGGWVAPDMMGYGSGGPTLSSSLASSNSSSASSSLSNLAQIPSFGAFQQPRQIQPLAGQLSLFTRELVDLMKATPGCRMPFHKFIPSYHHHFGRQCRVADYGYTKLKDLFEALPHVVQIMGEGRSRAVITLSHRAQVKRFTSDLLRVLKSQASKQVCLSELPAVFEKTLNRKFKISDYGVCDVEDILQEVSETSVVLSGEGDDVSVAIPKREQTQDEMERTHQFAQECVELLRHAPECQLPFNKFVPAYHHHFGRQCRVADYGFTKLIELFEAIPYTVEITEDADGERLLLLTDSERLAVLGSQVEALMTNTGKQKISLDQLEDLYRKLYGYPLRPDNYGETNVVSVLNKLPQILRVEEEESGLVVRLIDRTYIKSLSIQVKNVLAEDPEGRMSLKEFEEKFLKKYGTSVIMKDLKSDLCDLIVMEEADAGAEDQEHFIKLTALHLCSVKIQKLLEDHQDKILCSDFEAAFAEKYETPLCPGQYGYPSLNSLIRALPDYFAVRGRGVRKMIWYLRDGPIQQTSGSVSLVGPRGQRVPSGTMNRGGQATARFSTSRHEGFRLINPNSKPSRLSSVPRDQTGWGGSSPVFGGKFNNGSPMGSRFPAPSSTSSGSTSAAAAAALIAAHTQFPTSQQEMQDLAQFGLFPTGQNGQMMAGNPVMPKNTGRIGSQRLGLPSSSANNPFLSTPGSLYGSNRGLSTSPVVSPLFGYGQGGLASSLLPVPHSPSPLFGGFYGGSQQSGGPSGSSAASFVFPNQWSSYSNGPSTPPAQI